MILVVLLLSCTKESTEIYSGSSTTNTSSTTKTEALITVLDTDGNVKAGYSVMMFRKKPSQTEVLPTIEMEVISDGQGLARFDLENYISGPATLYFEAFTKSGDDYIWESITHPEKEMSKGTKWTTSIIVK